MIMNQDKREHKDIRRNFADSSFIKKRSPGDAERLHDELSSMLTKFQGWRGSTIKIYLFKLGYVYDLDLRKVARLVNLSPSVIQVLVGDPVRSIGAPDIVDLAYSDEHLFRLFPAVNDSIKIGVITASIQNNYFSRTNGNDSVVVSLYQSDGICQQAGKTKEDYLAQSIVTRVLWFLYREHSPAEELYHDDVRGCIFDLCINKKDKIYKLKMGVIDPMCRGKLIEANVPERFIRAVESILTRIRRPSFFDVFRYSLQKPLFSFIFGGLLFGLIINLVSSLILGGLISPGAYYITGFLVIAAILLLVANYFWTLASINKEMSE
jgi:hypothetical protein